MVLVPQTLSLWLMFSTLGFPVDVVPLSRGIILPNATTTITLSKLLFLITNDERVGLHSQRIFYFDGA